MGEDRPEDRPLIDAVLDVAFYAPVGLAMAVVEELPKLTEKGREHLAGRVDVARVVGKFAVAEAQRQLDRMLGGASGPSRVSRPSHSTDGSGSDSDDAVASNGRKPAQEAPHGPDADGVAAGRATETFSGSEASEGVAKPAVSPDTSHEVSPGLVAEDGARPSADGLAIPGYDTLAASQVVQRLSSLRRDELEAIRAYESGTRGRRTILHRVAQLIASDDRRQA